MIWNYINWFFRKIRVWQVGGKIYGNKYWSFQAGWFDEWKSIKLEIRYTEKCDHAGFNSWFEILGFHLMFDVYDNRHWNDDKGTWEK